MIEHEELDALRAKALAQIVEAPAGLSPQDFLALRQGFSPPNFHGGNK
jgi:hypothetical protein